VVLSFDTHKTVWFEFGLENLAQRGADDQDLINGARIFQGACFAYHLLNLGGPEFVGIYNELLM
jgi:hypothetical protein